MRKLKPIYKIIFTAIGVAIYIILALSFSTSKAYQKRCRSIKVEILDSNINMFVSAKDVNIILAKNELNVMGYPVKKINSLIIEKEIEKHPSIEIAHVYGNVKGSINVRIKQRTPIVRIMPDKGSGYYIDSKGKLMPLSSNYTARVIPVTGYIDRSLKDFRTENLQSVQSDTLLRQIFLLANCIIKDKYWSAVCDQIFIKKNNDIVLIPKIGAKKILLSSNGNYLKDLKTLTTFYKEVLPVIGWEKYKSINLQYNKQIVCK